MTIMIYDPTLRDGNHAISHSLSLQDIASYCRKVDQCGISVIEVGHGNGLGASSLQLGLASHSDRALLECARDNISNAQLGVHMIPGFAKINDIKVAVDSGVDVIRIAAHCTEADLTKSYIEYARKHDKTTQGVLMMTHMADAATLLVEAQKLQAYGSNSIVLMDSAGNYVERDVREKVGLLVENLDIPVGFHAHNNLSLAVANSLAAVEVGATMVDGTLCGFGAGAGNTQLEVLCAVLQRHGYDTGVDLFRLCSAIDELQDLRVTNAPTIKTSNLISGVYGVCSGFEKHVARAAAEFNVSPSSIYEELSKQHVLAGQEDMIIASASRLAKAAHGNNGEEHA
ncbi:4-hydroxy-2-oxovalerate aldolase [Pseudoalteromonas ardens]|uniref:4-hydroxy-2-oxovalerate aldolase n=1 Tax=Pseudoalteromonas rubra TaxID=43658 RepID=A0A0L0ES90_9GAMM|nr:4-hydroxy-2-oxovalerate aldolase [Pseudoalteromonas sp. R96]KNC66758.1 4-hydroxy-2-oxopentanoic acid aldolase [Pseudoalteromonas rubra]MDK1314041.1 4-hydroxy-2-oxovalerate aldolase [Pseudoalteromonas sp. R96]